MRVAIYSGAIPSTTFIEHLIRGIASAQVDVCIFGRENKKTIYTSPNVHSYPTPKNRVALLFFVVINMIVLLTTNRINFLKLCKHLKEKDELLNFHIWGKMLPIVQHLPDIFHLQWAKGAEEWLFLKELYKVQLVISFRGAHLNYSPIFDHVLAESYRRSFPYYDAFHCVSEAIAGEGVKYGAALGRTRVIYPAVDSSLLDIERVKKYNDKLHILSVGRDHWKKGYPVALDAMAILKQHEVNFHYTIVAGGEKEELRYQIEDLELEEYVTLIDNLPHHKVLELYSSNDLFLLPSFEEGVANVVLEAMALGIPVISTTCGGMTEVIADGVNGFLVPVRNPEAIADAIEKFIGTNNHDIKLIISRAKDKIRKNHLLENQVQEMIEFYKSVSDE